MRRRSPRRAACALAGWDYRRVGTPDPVLVENVRWLAGYRHPRFADGADRAACGRSSPNAARCWRVWRGWAGRWSTLPVVFHQLWHGPLGMDLACAADGRLVGGERG